jgi:hypothetical protein
MKNAQIQDAKCIICQEGITNPLCPACLAKEIKVWLREIKPEIMESVVEPVTNSHGIRCFSCGKGMSICAHCYSNDFYNYLKEEYPELAEEFLEHFNFDINIPSIFV